MLWSPQDLIHLRLAELDRVLPYFEGRRRVLEIGAGAGWQARHLHEKGFEVEAIEYAHPGFQTLAKERVWPIREYDGHRIPFEDNSFDVVFSSNVLEHIPHVRAFQHEIRRVLKPDGIAIHLMPTASWRFWSTMAHYVYLAKSVWSRLVKRDRPADSSDRQKPAVPQPTAGTRKTLATRLKWWLIPERHGEEGNFLTEMVHFSRWKWRRVFRDAGFRVVHEGSNRLFYTGYGIAAGRLSIPVRARLSRWLGGSCRCWVLTQSAQDTDA